MKRITLLAALLIVVVGGVLWWRYADHHRVPVPVQVSVATAAASDPKDATYVIDGKSVILMNGSAESGIEPGSASKLETRYFGNEVDADLNGDGVPDAAFLLTQSSGGSGTFYYVVAALKMADGYHGTNAILLGDRIAPQMTEIHDGELIVNYAEHAPTDPMTAQPSHGVSKYLRVVDGSLVEVAGK